MIFGIRSTWNERTQPQPKAMWIRFSPGCKKLSSFVFMFALYVKTLTLASKWDVF